MFQMFALCFLTPRCEVEGMAARRTSSGDGASGSGGIGASGPGGIAAWGLALFG